MYEVIRIMKKKGKSMKKLIIFILMAIMLCISAQATVWSVTDIRFNSEEPDLNNKPAFTVILSPDGQGDLVNSLKATISPSLVKQKTGLNVENVLTISSSSVPQKCVYKATNVFNPYSVKNNFDYRAEAELDNPYAGQRINLNVVYQPIKSFIEVKSTPKWGFPQIVPSIEDKQNAYLTCYTGNSNMGGPDNPFTFEVHNTGRNDIYCLSFQKKGTIGNLDLFKETFGGTIAISNSDGFYEDATVSTDTTPVAILKDSRGIPRVKMKLEGALKTGNFCPSIKDLASYFDLGTNSWKVISNEQAVNYKNDHKIMWGSSTAGLQDPGMSYTSYSQTQANDKTDFRWKPLQNAATSLRNSEQKIGGYNSYSQSMESCSGEAPPDCSMFTVRTRTPTSKPVIILQVSADLLEIIKPYGVPLITDIRAPPKFVSGSGSGGVWQIDIFNKGPYDSSFTLSVKCSGTLTGSSKQINIQAATSKTIEVPFSGSSGSQDKSVSCVAEVFANNKITAKDAKAFTQKVEGQPGGCTDGVKMCNPQEPNVLLQCTNKQFAFKEECEFSCSINRCLSSGEFCKENPTYAACQNKCESCFGWLKGILGDKCVPQPLIQYKLFGFIPMESRLTHANFCPILYSLILFAILGAIAYYKREQIQDYIARMKK
jgi:hypothetical protein